MSNRTKTSKQTKAQTTTETLRRWRRVQGLLAGRGPKDVLQWQRKGRRDRKIMP